MATSGKDDKVSQAVDLANCLITLLTIIASQVLAFDPEGIEEYVGCKPKVEAATLECRFAFGRIPRKIHKMKVYVIAV
jgi:hypothetical protein